MHKRFIEVNIAPLMQRKNRREAFAFAPAQRPEGRRETPVGRGLGDHLDSRLHQRRGGGCEKGGGGENKRGHG